MKKPHFLVLVGLFWLSYSPILFSKTMQLPDIKNYSSSILWIIALVTIFILASIIYKLYKKNIKLDGKNKNLNRRIEELKKDLTWEKSNRNSLKANDNKNDSIASIENLEKTNKIQRDKIEELNAILLKTNPSSEKLLKTNEDKSKFYPVDTSNLKTAFYFDEFSEGFMQKNESSKSHYSVYQITANNKGEGSIDLIFNDSNVGDYLANKDIYLPTFVCNIRYAQECTQTNIRVMKPGIVKLENGEWKIIEKIELEII